MSTHINAPDGAIAPRVLLPGDPLRAKFIAENFLENAVCYNEVRGMYGFTGSYNGVKVSVQGSGMGQPSLSIYVNELFRFYDVQKIIRVGTIGSVQEDVKVRDRLEKPEEYKFIRLEILQKLDNIEAEIDEMKAIVKSEKLSEDTSDEEIYQLKEKIRALENQIVNIIS